MNTRAVATELRLSHWAGIMRQQQDSGLSKAAFCKQAGFHENIFYYWQKKLRERACEELLAHTPPEPVTVDNSTIPTGWAVCEAAPTDTSKTLPIEINGCCVLASADTDAELLARTCKVLMSLC